MSAREVLTTAQLQRDALESQRAALHSTLARVRPWALGLPPPPAPLPQAALSPLLAAAPVPGGGPHGGAPLPTHPTSGLCGPMMADSLPPRH